MKDNGLDPARLAGHPQRGEADLGLLAMAVIWGVNFPFIKASLEEIPPLAFNALRFPLAAATLYLILRASGTIPVPERGDRGRILGLGILGNVVYQAFFIFGIHHTLAGNASVLLATTPIWATGLSTLRGHERPGRMVWVGIAATLAGMILVVLGGGEETALSLETLKGDALIVGAAVTWSAYSVGSRRMVLKYGSLPVTAWTLWIGSLFLFFEGLPSLFPLPYAEISPLAWGGVAYAGILAIGVAYILWYRGVQHLGNSRTAAYSNLTPIVALTTAWVWLGEAPQVLQLAGAAVVLGGVSMARLGGEKAP